MEAKETTEELFAKYVYPNYGRLPVSLQSGAGARLRDEAGREYIDFVAGIAVCNVGHCHPAVVEAARAQLGRLIHVSNLFLIREQGLLAKRLIELAFPGRAFFCNSGAEANEAAIKLARRFGNVRGGRFEVLSAKDSFHGRTLGALSATGQPAFHAGFEPLPEGFKYFTFNDVDSLLAAIGPKTCAVLLEPIQGEIGVRKPAPGFLAEVRKICDERGLLLIFDEVQVGLGRTGRFFAYEHWGVRPDVMTLAKGLAGGLAMGAMIAREGLEGVLAPGSHASTFGGNPLACAAALANIDVIAAPGFLDEVRRKGEILRTELEAIARRTGKISEVRALGLMAGTDLKVDAAKTTLAARERGLLIIATKTGVLRFLPPLVISEADLRQGLAIVEEALESIA